MSTGPAGHKACIPPPVQEQDGLFPPFQPLCQKPLKPSAENGAVPLLQLLPQILNIYLWQTSSCQAFSQGIESVFPLPGPVIGFQGRGGRTQYHTGTMEPGHLPGHLPGMVFGGRLALITALMFLVYHDQADIWKRGEQCRPGTYDHIDLPLPGPFTLVIFLPRRKSGVQYTDPVPKTPVESQQGLVGQGDLRDQHHRLPAPFHNSLYQADIHFRLTASGDAVEQVGAHLSLVIIGQYFLHHLPLGLTQCLLFLP